MTEPHSRNVEARLLDRVRSGDRSALAPLLLCYHDRLHAFVVRKLRGTPTEALAVDDVLQETCCRAFKALPHFDAASPAAVLAWLKTIAQNYLIDLARQGRRRPLLRAAADGHASSSWSVDQLARIADPSGTPRGKAARREAFARLQTALASLPDHYRQALRLHYLDELPLQSVAQRMKISEQAVRGVLQRARKKMRDALRPGSF